MLNLKERRQISKGHSNSLVEFKLTTSWQKQKDFIEDVRY